MTRKSSKKQNGQQKEAVKKPHFEWRRLITIVLALVMIAALLLPMLSGAFTMAHAVTQSELKDQISGLKEDADETAAQKKELQEKLQAIAQDKNKALERKQLMDEQLAAIESQIENTQNQINTYIELIAAQEQALAEAQVREQEAYEKFCERARSMEEAGTVSYWSVLFRAKSFSDLLDRLALVNEIMAYDNSVVDALAAARQEVETKLAELNQSKEALDEQKALLDSQKAEQEEKVKEAQALVDELKTQEDTAEAMLADAEQEEKEIDQKIAAKEKELNDLIEAERKRREAEEAARAKAAAEAAERERQRQIQLAQQRAAQQAAAQQAAAQQQANSSDNSNSSASNSSESTQTTTPAAPVATPEPEPATVSTGSGYFYPLPSGYTNVTSGFGGRKDPITGKQSTHNGVDIAAPGGTPIYAAQGGVVSISGYASSSYGNYVVINHGGGITTLYAHMSSRAVSAGQTVSQGQVIGYVGKTGRATGNHLHIELRVNGVRKDARTLFPGVSFY